MLPRMWPCKRSVAHIQMSKMNINQETEVAWASWYEFLQKHVVTLMNNGDYDRALSQLDDYLAVERLPEVRSDAIAFRANLRKEMGDLEAAKTGYLEARSLVPPSYTRYVDELCLGQICEDLGNKDEAANWYRTSLDTCLRARDVSGGTALQKFLEINPPNNLTSGDRELCIKVIEQSWLVLGLPGRPNYRNLKDMISAIKNGEANPPGKSIDGA